MIDFGCVKTFPEDFLDGCIRLVQNYLLGNHSGFTDELVKMEFLKNSDAEEATEKMIKEKFPQIECVGAISIFSNFFQ